MRLIDADALLARWCSEVCKPKPNCNEDCMIYDYLTMNFLSPTIEPIKRGKWVKNEDRRGWHCSMCQEDDLYAFSWNSDTGRYDFQDRYCPNCGARMEKEV